MKYILDSLTKLDFSREESSQSFHTFLPFTIILHQRQALGMNIIKQSAMSTIELSALAEATNSLTIEQKGRNLNAWTGPSTAAFDFRSMHWVQKLQITQF
jgi:hypothetical protein